MNCVERVLSAEICEKVESKLAEGNSLSKELLNRVHGRQFRVRSLLPSTVSDDVALNIDHGGLFESKEPLIYIEKGVAIEAVNDEPATRWLVDQIAHYFEKHSEAFLIFEHALACRGDTFLSNRVSEILYFGDEVLMIVRAKENAEERIRKAIKESYSIPTFIGAFSLPQQQTTFTSQELEQNDLREIALGAEAIILGAYDGEGFLLCDELPAAQKH